MTRYVYDEEASRRLHMDVAYEIDDRPVSPTQRVEAMRRLNSIDDPLARQIVELHRDCGSGSGPCDDIDDDPDDRGAHWGCETTSIVATYFGIEFPGSSEE